MLQFHLYPCFSKRTKKSKKEACYLADFFSGSRHFHLAFLFLVNSLQHFMLITFPSYQNGNPLELKLNPISRHRVKLCIRQVQSIGQISDETREMRHDVFRRIRHVFQFGSQKCFHVDNPFSCIFRIRDQLYLEFCEFVLPILKIGKSVFGIYRSIAEKEVVFLEPHTTVVLLGKSLFEHFMFLPFFIGYLQRPQGLDYFIIPHVYIKVNTSCVIFVSILLQISIVALLFIYLFTLIVTLRFLINLISHIYFQIYILFLLAY